MNESESGKVIRRPGISHTTLVSAGIRYSDYPEPGSIEIPYWTSDGEITQFKRWRLPEIRSNGQKYHQIKGSGVYCYFPPGFFRRSKENAFGLAADSVVLVEGEFKALSLLELGVYTIGLPSFNVYLKDENEHRRLLHDLQVTFSREKIKTIYFLGDADTATNFEFARHAAFLASGAYPAQVFLPRIPLDRPKGIDDCKEALGAELGTFFTELIKEAIPLPKQCELPQMALLIFEPEIEPLKKLSGVERERQFNRIIKLCGAAQRFGKSHATTRLCKLAREVMGLNATELKNAISAQGSSNGESSHKPETEQSQTPPPTPVEIVSDLAIYYDAVATTFWVQNDRDGWIKVKTEDVKARLAKMGYRRKSGLLENISQVDLLLIEIQNSHDVDYAGSLAGFKKGVYIINESRVLVKDSPRLIAPAKGEWPLLEGIFLRMFGPQQQEHFFGWLKVALESLYSGQQRVGQALVFAGPRDSGKSLVQALITKLLGNRSHKPHRYMNGETPFNGELFAAEHLIIEDEEASTDIRSRRKFGTKLKEIAANPTHSCHPKNRPALHLPPFWRPTISVNDEPENLMILPPMDESIEDKIIILKVSKHQMPLPTVTLEERKIFMDTLEAELPHLVDFLLNWKIPEPLISQRYGITHFHHPDILQALGAFSPEIRLLEMIDAELFNSSAPYPWEGTAADLERKLQADGSDVKREAGKLFSFQAACGTYLARLQKLHKDRFSSKRTNKGTHWTIKPPEKEE